MIVIDKDNNGNVQITEDEDTETLFPNIDETGGGGSVDPSDIAAAVEEVADLKSALQFSSGRITDIDGKESLEFILDSKTINGLTITRNSYNSYTINGTATARTELIFTSSYTLEAGTYKIDSGVSAVGTGVNLRLNSSGAGNISGSVGYIYPFTVGAPTTYDGLRAVITNGTNVSALTLTLQIINDDSVVTDLKNEIASATEPPFINSAYYQYIDIDKWENGWYWGLIGGNLQKIANASYNAYPPFRLKAGSYHVNNLSGSFSFAVYDDSTRAQFSSLVSNNILSLPYDATVYVSNSNITYSMLSTGELIYENGQPVFVSGKYHLSTKQIFYVGSTRPIKTLKDGIEKATEYFDSIVMVDAEDFDLVAEFGQSYLDTYSDTAKMIGLWLKNRVHVIFASGARVLFNYTGSNAVVHTNFSPFNAGDYGFTLENAWVESTNCRYAVHDELNSSAIPYKNVYKGCTFIHDSSATSWGAHQAIGGGLGLHGDILIADCYASAVGSKSEVMSYHNATSLTAESYSRIVVKGTYLEGTFRVSNYGTSTRKSQAFVHNCSFLSEPNVQTTITPERADNMEMFKWNNEIRTT